MSASQATFSAWSACRRLLPARCPDIPGGMRLEGLRTVTWKIEVA
jgi:hypothetical protein